MSIEREARVDVNRRKALKLGAGALAAPYVITPRKGLAQVAPVIPPSPPTQAWAEEIKWPRSKEPVSTLWPTPMGQANTSGGENFPGGECGRGQHQAWDRFGDNTLLYEMRVREASHRLNAAYPSSNIWGFDSQYPGPVFRNFYRRPVLVRIHNELNPDYVGFGTPEISTHLHNMHTPSASDGFPGDFFGPAKFGPTLTAPGQFRDHFYPMVYAGCTDPQYAATDGDPREALGTLWYHDHCMDFTAANVVRGLAGFHIMYDELDSNDENDTNPAALRLPSGEFDMPLMFQDLRIDPNTYQVVFDQLSPEGVVGDKIPVNGIIEPFMKVARRKYRLRLLNGGPSRNYEFYLVTATNAIQTFTYIANDGNLLPAPLLNRKNVRLGVAERGDIVVDFSKYPLGTELYLINRLRQTDTRKPDEDLLSTSTAPKLLKFIIDREPPEADNSRVPSVLRALPNLPDLSRLRTRSWTFKRENGVWTVNGRLFDVHRVSAQIPKGSAEIWNLHNGGGGWLHPVHIHFEEGRILRKWVEGKEVPVPDHERGRKDVYVLGPNDSVRLVMRFRDFPGKFPTHCHNVYHEDHAMMFRWDIV
ncbi:MAG: multicopper oxidase domain-containing protein [Burkholderiales bacterium]